MTSADPATRSATRARTRVTANSTLATLHDIGDIRDRRVVRETSAPYRVAVLDDQDLVSTPAAAKSLGVSGRTLQRYVKDGLITPDLTLPSGQYRWDPTRLRQQINALSGRR